MHIDQQDEYNKSVIQENLMSPPAFPHTLRNPKRGQLTQQSL